MKGSLSQHTRVILRRVDHTFNLNAVRKESVENEVVFEITNAPHSHTCKLVKLPDATDFRHFSQFSKSNAGGALESAGHFDAGVFRDISEMVNQVAAGCRPDRRANGHLVVRRNHALWSRRAVLPAFFARTWLRARMISL